ncbi:conserved hypothetical protein [Leishmania braziliensis MHOM/BR/75/M2904]|uniref:Uncharacterized protein n=2 Tax=Leishmania braziliensis TaxID=5660 RepID=A4HEQ6_LEIBR|nr:conserved hypothetical protein [Leishmania braziliensis MHOM/BR/75/M2904]KAI5685443.1 hypothetical protein MNV84_04638 [Leishmania braziliensis]CAJ2474558.1 unnamed protein product [Leishmania braziliensis]CAM39314.1 conserved hypothetical protein [Leishmania braziliensis MHOM/BR/75/M2904]SYZ66713.1 Leucine_Rich_repeat [Leishmania braziliensis MHOM/BR/75/M2904]
MQIPWRQISKPQLDSICLALADRKTDAPIRAVDFMDNQLGPTGALRIASCLESSPVTKVLICYNDIGKEGCDGLAEVVNLSNSLHVLDIRGNRLSASDAHRLLRSVSLSTSLTRLGLASNRLGPEGAALVAKVLESNTYLSSLDLSVNELGASGAEYIAGALRNPASALQVLQLHGNYLGATGVTMICDAVKTNKELKRLTLGNNHATDEAASAIAAMLNANYILEELDIRLNTLTTRGVKTIAQQGLAKNTTLRMLSLSGNEVGHAGANELTHVLASHQRSALGHLDLSSCGLTSSGGVQIARLLSMSISLKEINLSDNALDDEAAVRLAQSIADSISISVVDLSCNEIGEEGASQLIGAVLRNAQLAALVTNGNNISRVAQKKIDNVLEERLTKNRALSRNTALYQQQQATCSAA